MSAFLLSFYRLLTRALSPAAPALLKWRLKHGKEDAARLRERMGYPGRERPEGTLVWLHGASVGEAVAVLPLIDALRERNLHVLLTTGTVTSANLMRTRLPAAAIHQFAPLDAPAFVSRFLDHWRPDVALFAESELWPNLLAETAARGASIALVNARLSARSAERWKKLPGAIGALLGFIDVTLAQTPEDAARFMDLGARRVLVTGNLKYDVPALPCDPLELANLKGVIGARPVWVAASTHDGEEDIAVAAHQALSARWPDLVTIIVPRHPERGAAIAASVAARGIAVRLRSQHKQIGAEGCVYVADTIGELGLFYRIGGIVFVGRSLVRHGGQNPIEPAKLGNAVLHGPNVSNFTDVYRELDEKGGALEVADAQRLAETLAELFSDAARTRAIARAASETVDKLGGATQAIMNAIDPYLLQKRLEQD